MNRTITVDLPEQVYTTIERTAAERGLSLDAWLAEHLTSLAPSVSEDDEDDEDDEDGEEPAFWHMPDNDREWEEWQARAAERRRNPPPTPEQAAEMVRATLRTWAPHYLASEDAIEMAMGEDWMEWNLKL